MTDRFDPQDGSPKVELNGALGSLKEVVERNDSVDKKPMLFCFGLLERFDVKQLVAMVAPRQVRFIDPGKRAKDELKDLKDFYATLGSQFDPLIVEAFLAGYKKGKIDSGDK